jgi:hypothetical protein
LSFVLDTGSNLTFLTPRCGQRFPGLIKNASRSTQGLSGAGGGEVETIYEVPEFPCKGGASECHLQNVKLYTQPDLANLGVDGVIGQDLWQKNGFEIKFRTLQFQVIGRAIGPFAESNRMGLEHAYVIKETD